MSKKWLILVMTLIVLLVTMPLLTACDDDDDDEEETKTMRPTSTAEPTKAAEPTETVTPTEVKEETLHFGMLTVYTMSPSAKDWSFWLAIDEINEAGGMKVGDTVYKWTESVEDDKNTSAGAVSAMQKLLYEDNSDFIICQTVLTPPAARPYTEEEKIINFAWVAPDLWTDPEFPYCFTNNLDQALGGPILFDWISQNRPDIKTIGVVYGITTENEERVRIWKKMSPAEYGIEIKGFSHDSTVRDFYPVLTDALSGDHPDAMVVEQPNVVQQAQDLGFEGTFITTQDVPDYWYYMLKPEAMEGLISLSMNVDDQKTPQWFKNYKQAYIDWRDVIPYSYWTCGSYLTVYIVSAAIEAAQSVDSDAVKAVLETQTLTLKFPKGETLDVKFYGEEYYGVNHTWQPPQMISVHQDGKPVNMEEVTGEETQQYRALYESYR